MQVWMAASKNAEDRARARLVLAPRAWHGLRSRTVLFAVLPGLIVLSIAQSGAASTSSTASSAVHKGADSGAVVAGDPGAKDRLSVYAMLGFATNPTAAALFAGVSRRVGIPGDGSVLFRELYFEYGAEVILSGLERPALYAEWMPIRIFKLRLQYDLWIWPGFALGRGHGLVFDGKDAPFGPDELQRRKGEELPGLGHRLALIPTLQAKVGPVVLIDTAEFAGWFVHGERSFWREPLNDNLIERGAPDATLKNTLLLLLHLWSNGPDTRLLFGAIHEVVHTVAADITRHRVGPAMILTPAAELAGIARPTIFFLFGVNAIDRNRDGETWMQLGLRGDLDLQIGEGP